jgi:hypothetical protein
MSKDNNSVAMMSACVHGMQPDAVELHRDANSAGLFIYLDPDRHVSIRVDLRPGLDDWEASRLGLEKLARVAGEAARQVAELQAAAQAAEASGG